MIDTRQRLLDAATRVLAEEGVENASLLEVARRAGQRNRGAVHYHFGSRTGLVVAVLEQYADWLGERQGERRTAAEQTPEDQLAPVVEAVVRPVVELGETGWRGRCYLVVVAELCEADQATLDPDVATVLERTGGVETYVLLRKRLPPMGEALKSERLALFTGFVLRSVADRARAVERGNGRAQVGTDDFADTLVAMGAGMLAAPPVGAGRTD